MKIAVYYNLPYGGAKRAVFEHVKGLMQLKHQVDVYTLNSEIDAFSPETIASKKYSYQFDILQLFLFRKVATDLQVFFRLKKLHEQIARDIDKKNYDLVLVHTDSYTQTPFLLRFLQSKSVYYCLEPLRIGYEYSLRIPQSFNIVHRLYEAITRYYRKRIDRINARSATFSLALSHFCRAYMVQAYDIFPRVSYLGVDQTVFHKKSIIKKNQVLFIAGKDQLTGYDLATKALSLIPQNIRPELKIVYGIKQAERITDDQLVTIYNESVATLSLSRLDTFGLVPLESMACTTPVIAMNIAGYRELVIEAKTGFLVELDPEAIAQKIMLLIQNPKIGEDMGKAGRTWIEESWTWDYQIKLLEKQLKEFIKLSK